jgi:hypothetical protein
VWPAEEVTYQRTVAESSVCFFENIVPLARRLGMTTLPEVGDCRSRLLESEDVSTERLRADGLILLRVCSTATTEVEHQRVQDAVLGTCWPTGSGIVARTRLLDQHLPRATVDVAALGDIGSAMVVAAESIDAARLAKFACVSTIAPDAVLGVPIGLWLAPDASPTLPGNELRAAIVSTIALFTNAVAICDDAIDAIMTGLSDAMASMDTSDYGPIGCGTQLAPEPTPAKPPPCPSQSGDQPSAPATPSVTPVAAGPPGDGSPTTPIVPTTMPQCEPAAAVAPASGVDDVAAVLGQVAAAIGHVVTGSLAAGIEMMSVGSGSMPVSPSASTKPDLIEPFADVGSLPDDRTSITLGDKTIDIEAGDNSMTLTVHGPDGNGDTQVFAVSPDGSIEELESKAPAAHTHSEKCDTDEPTDTSASATDPASGESSTSAGPADTDEPNVAGAGPPQPTNEPDCPVPVPPVRYVPGDQHEPDVPAATAVAPQASEPGDPVPPNDGLLALAGEQ